VVELLLKKGVDINFSDANGCNALHIASANGFTDTTKLLLEYWAHHKSEQKGDIFDIDVPDNLSLTSLMKASINNHLEIVKMLLNFGANPRIRTKNGESALTLACMQENLQIVEKLIVAKADVNEIDEHKRTPLLKAARHNSKNEILELLLKNGARHDLADEEGNTPLHFAAMRGTVEVAKFLMNLGANPYARNN
jgi:ankyrin repeat protein